MSCHFLSLILFFERSIQKLSVSCFQLFLVILNYSQSLPLLSRTCPLLSPFHLACSFFHAPLLTRSFSRSFVHSFIRSFVHSLIVHRFHPLIRVGHNYYLFYIYFRSCDQELNPNHYRIIPVPFPFHYRGYPRLYLIHYRTLVGLFAHKICSCKSGKNGKVPHFILIRLVPFLTKLVPFLPPKGTSLLFPSLY